MPTYLVTVLDEVDVICPICETEEATDHLVDTSVHVFCCRTCLPDVTATFAAYGRLAAR